MQLGSCWFSGKTNELQDISDKLWQFENMTKLKSLTRDRGRKLALARNPIIQHICIMLSYPVTMLFCIVPGK